MEQKTLYCLQVPSGSYARERQIMELCARLVGGCSKRQVEGVWVDPEVKQTIWEPITELQFTATEFECAAIVYEAMILYPNERAFFLAVIGRAAILDREKYISDPEVRACVDRLGPEAVENDNEEG